MISQARASLNFAFALVVVSVTATAARCVEVDFNRQVRPILTEFCFSCHGPDANQRKADLRLDLEVEAKKSSIVSKSSNESELIHRIRSQDDDSIMPPPATGKVLSKAQIELLSQWIDEGAKYSDHWAFQPIRQSSQLLSELPQNETTIDAPIDRFLLHKLSAVDLSYSQEISRSQLIRRATFDLTGLPPSWDEVEAFEEDHADGHIHSLAIAFDGKDQMTQVWIWRQDGHSAPMTFTLRRKK